MLFKSALLTQASGSIGGITASRNRGGMYFRARAIPTDPATSFQLAQRALLTSLAQRWNTTLTQDQRDEWDLYASLVTLIGPLGDPVTVSGQNMYIRSNAAIAQGGDPIVDDGPIQFDLGDLGLITVDTAIESAQTFNVNFDTTRAWANDDDGGLLVAASRPQNPSISFFQGPFRFAARLSGITIAAPPTPFTVDVPFPITAGSRLWVRIRSFEADGRLSSPIIVGPTLVVA